MTCAQLRHVCIGDSSHYEPQSDSPHQMTEEKATLKSNKGVARLRGSAR
jgi:hypothetical protein